MAACLSGHEADGEGREHLRQMRRKAGMKCKAAQNPAHWTHNKPPFDPTLAAVIEARPTLPEAIKAGILAMVSAVKSAD
jgi:hypothetical protein